MRHAESPSRDATSYTLDEISGLSGVSPRTIRYYIQIGMLAGPSGETRAARYSPAQLAQLVAIRNWQASGLSLERIGTLLAATRAPHTAHRPPSQSQRESVRVWTRYTVADGVELHIEPGHAGLKPEQARALMRAVKSALDRIHKEA